MSQENNSSNIMGVKRELPPTIADQQAVVQISGLVLAQMVAKFGISHYWTSPDGQLRLPNQVRIREITELAKMIVQELKK